MISAILALESKISFPLYYITGLVYNLIFHRRVSLVVLLKAKHQVENENRKSDRAKRAYHQSIGWWLSDFLDFFGF
jgi:hypothetical protein